MNNKARNKPQLYRFRNYQKTYQYIISSWATLFCQIEAWCLPSISILIFFFFVPNALVTEILYSPLSPMVALNIVSVALSILTLSIRNFFSSLGISLSFFSHCIRKGEGREWMFASNIIVYPHINGCDSYDTPKHTFGGSVKNINQYSLL